MAEVYLDWKMKQIIIIIIIFILALGRSVHQNMEILFNGKEIGHRGDSLNKQYYPLHFQSKS